MTLHNFKQNHCIVAPPFPQLRLPFLLVVPIIFEEDDQGRIWLDKLWHQDLIAHLDYLPNLTVLAPRRRVAVPSVNWVEVRPTQSCSVQFRAFAPAGGIWQALRSLPYSLLTTWQMVAKASVVQSCVVGWPYPPGFIANPVALLQGKPLINIVESAFWRLQESAQATMKARIRAVLNEAFARWSLRRSRLGIYTHSAYCESLPVGSGGMSAVLPASWISEHDLLTPDAALAAWDSKPVEPRFLLPSRLTSEKGISLFIEAVQLLELEGHCLIIDVIGAGPLRDEVASLAASARHLRINMLDPLPYGTPFMCLVRSYHAVIIPTISDEQPRIIYDAFAQAVPVVASDTPGNIEVVTDGINARIFRSGSATNLAAALVGLAAAPKTLRQMGIAALSIAHNYTHTAMHRKRAEILTQLFETPLNRKNHPEQ